MLLNEVSAVVLASGMSRRFKGGSKLLATYKGKPVAEYIATTLSALPTKRNIVVIPLHDDGLRQLFKKYNFEIVENAHPEQGLGKSLSLGVIAARKTNPSAILVCLADMPYITKNTIIELCSSIGDADAVICSDGKTSSPPALFVNGAFDKLTNLEKDVGARKIFPTLRHVAQVKVESTTLLDIDTSDDLL